MAVTKIWDVKSHLSSLVAYVSNVDKTTEYYNEETLKALVEYGVDDLKTEERKFVSTIGCTREDAASVMAELNRNGNSKSDTVAYHGYQSFAPGEVDAKTAHEIGVKLANELWGDNFPVVVATHLDRGHLHNHFAISATGYNHQRYHDCNETYRMMREASDRLCLEYGLSVVKDPKRGKTRHIGEIKAEEEGRPTVRSIIRRNMDIAIEHYLATITDRQQYVFIGRFYMGDKLEVIAEELNVNISTVHREIEKIKQGLKTYLI